MDASDTGLGAVLLRKQKLTKTPVAYMSRKLMPREQKEVSVRNFRDWEISCISF